MNARKHKTKGTTMKAIIVAGTLALFTTPALAMDICENVGEFAEAVMGARQRGVLLSDMMDRVRQVNPAIREMALVFTLAAYEGPRYRTEGLQEDAIIEFRNNLEFACYEGAWEASR